MNLRTIKNTKNFDPRSGGHWGVGEGSPGGGKVNGGSVRGRWGGGRRGGRWGGTGGSPGGQREDHVVNSKSELPKNDLTDSQVDHSAEHYSAPNAAIQLFTMDLPHR